MLDLNFDELQNFQCGIHLNTLVIMTHNYPVFYPKGQFTPRSKMLFLSPLLWCYLSSLSWCDLWNLGERFDGNRLFGAQGAKKKKTFEETKSLSRDYDPVTQDDPQILLWAVSGWGYCVSVKPYRRKQADRLVSKPFVQMSDCVLPSSWWYWKKNSSYLKLRQSTWSRVRISGRRCCCWVYFREKDLGLQVKMSKYETLTCKVFKTAALNT